MKENEAKTFEYFDWITSVGFLFVAKMKANFPK